MPKEVIILLTAAGVISLIFFIGTFICFKMCFWGAPKKKENALEFLIPDGSVYLPYRDEMIESAKETRELPFTEMSVVSHDGLTLRGKFYEYTNDAAIEIMFPGYRGNARRDLCGGAKRCFAAGHSSLIVDQRGCGFSDGHVVSFGINESRDCLRWVDAVIKARGEDCKIILTGVSMGAATVLLAAGSGKLPPNVIGVVADCGFSSAEEIIRIVMKKMGVPVKLLYPFVRLGGMIYGHFDINDARVAEAVRRIEVPVFFAHGDDDRYVPYFMGEDNYKACRSKKMLLTAPGTAHGLAYYADKELYINELKSFFAEEEGLNNSK